MQVNTYYEEAAGGEKGKKDKDGKDGKDKKDKKDKDKKDKDKKDKGKKDKDKDVKYPSNPCYQPGYGQQMPGMTGPTGLDPEKLGEYGMEDLKHCVETILGIPVGGKVGEKGDKDKKDKKDKDKKDKDKKDKDKKDKDKKDKDGKDKKDKKEKTGKVPDYFKMQAFHFYSVYPSMCYASRETLSQFFMMNRPMLMPMFGCAPQQMMPCMQPMMGQAMPMQPMMVPTGMPGMAPMQPIPGQYPPAGFITPP